MANDEQSPPAPPPPPALPERPVYGGPPRRKQPRAGRPEDPAGTMRAQTSELAHQVGQRIRAVRNYRQMSQDALAERLHGRSRIWLSAVENGRQLISTPLLSLCSQALEVSVSYLLTGTLTTQDDIPADLLADPTAETNRSG